MPKPVPTHTAYVLKRETRTTGVWLEIGSAHIKSDGTDGGHHIYLDRLPLGGFGGHIVLQPIGVNPPDPEPDPPPGRGSDREFPS